MHFSQAAPAGGLCALLLALMVLLAAAPLMWALMVLVAGTPSACLAGPAPLFLAAGETHRVFRSSELGAEAHQEVTARCGLPPRHRSSVS